MLGSCEDTRELLTSDIKSKGRLTAFPCLLRSIPPIATSGRTAIGLVGVVTTPATHPAPGIQQARSHSHASTLVI